MTAVTVRESSQPKQNGGEFEHEAVPVAARRPLRSVAAVWLGFPMIMTSAIFGGMVTYNLGFLKGLLAIVAGNVVLVAYVGLLSLHAGRTGESFALTARRVFGPKAYVVVAGLLSTLVIGWFAFQTGIVGETLHATMNWSAPWMSLLAGVLFLGITLLGIRALAVIGVWASAAFAVLGVVAVVIAARGVGISRVVEFAGADPGTALSFGACVTLIVACFIDSGTMTSDFTRWARNGREGFLASLAAFPIGNLFAQVIGALIVALGAAVAPATSGGDFMHVLAGAGGLLVPIAVVFTFLNLGSVCAHCLYNGAVGWGQLSGKSMRTLTIVLGVLGTAAATAGIYSHFAEWLTLLSIVVPPIGAIIIVDVLAVRRTTGADRAIRPSAFASWAIGSAAAFAVHFLAPQFSEAVVAMVVSAAAYALVSRSTSKESAR